MRCKKIWCLSLFIFETSESLSVGPKPNVEITSLAKLQKKKPKYLIIKDGIFQGKPIERIEVEYVTVV